MFRHLIVLISIVLLCVPQFGLQAASTAPSPPAAVTAAATAPAGQADAFQLIDSARRALSQVVRAAENDAAVPQGSAKAKPLWNALKTLNDSLARAETSGKLQSKEFFNEMASAVAAVDQAEIAMTMQPPGKALTDEFARLATLVRALDENYSKEGARLKQGGELTRNELEQLRNLRAQQDDLAIKLADVERKAGKNNEAIQEGIRKIKNNSEKIKRSKNTAAGFAGAMVAARMMSGWMWGWHWWWGPSGWWCPGWIDVVVIDIWVPVWDDYAYDWGYLDGAIDVADLDLADLYDDDVGLDADLMETDALLDEGDYGLADGDIAELSNDMDMGWDDVSTDAGYEVRDQMEDNFDHAPFDSGFDDVNTFDDFGGYSDFGGGFDDF